VRSIVWATGFGRSYPWLRVPGVGADSGLAHRRGITPVRGLYALGLRLQHRRSSHMIGGVGRDAQHIAAHIVEAAARPFAQRVAARRARPTLRHTAAALG
jgi:putative flavoprotein involved in K+ transport